jgi:hypothetical protein
VIAVPARHPHPVRWLVCPNPPSVPACSSLALAAA